MRTCRDISSTVWPTLPVARTAVSIASAIDYGLGFDCAKVQIDHERWTNPIEIRTQVSR